MKSRQGFVVVLEMSVSKCADGLLQRRRDPFEYCLLLIHLIIAVVVVFFLFYTYMIKIRLNNIKYFISLAHVLYPHAFIFARFLPIFCKGKQLFILSFKTYISNALIKV